MNGDTEDTSIPAKRLLIRDLPGVADLEVDLMMRRGAYEGVEEDLVGKVAQKLFGITSAELGEIYDQHDRDDENDPDDLLTAWEMADDETMEKMLTIGVDFSDERGHPLRCTNFLAGPAEVAVRGLAGHLPDQGQLQIDRMASKLEQDREAFLASKRKQGRR